jgi:mannose/fructose/N-acetylgalactosamine-specific phosphotransferase system component IID
MAEQELDAATQQALAENETLRIMYDHFMNQYKDAKKAIAAINYIGEQVQQPGCKLIHLDNVVFMISVSAAKMVEMHAMMGGNPTEQQKLEAIDKQLDKLLPMLKELGAKLAYTYMLPNKAAQFRKVLKEYKFYEKSVKIENKTYIAFYVEV